MKLSDGEVVALSYAALLVAAMINLLFKFESCHGEGCLGYSAMFLILIILDLISILVLLVMAGAKKSVSYLVASVLILSSTGFIKLGELMSGN